MAPRGKKGNVNVHGLTNSKKVSKKQKMNKTKGQKAQKFIIERRLASFLHEINVYYYEAEPSSMQILGCLEISAI